MNTTTKNENFYKDPERIILIRKMKDRLITIKPVRDEVYGNINQHLFLQDYVLYALLRNVNDFTKTASKKEKAILCAQDILKFLKMCVRDVEKAMLNAKDISENDALKGVKKSFNYTGYRKINEIIDFTGENPLLSIKLLIEDVEIAISKAVL
jgi:hypothetical protein